MRAFHESPECICSDLTCIKRLSQKVVCFCCLLNDFEASLTNSIDPDKTAPVGAV